MSAPSSSCRRVCLARSTEDYSVGIRYQLLYTSPPDGRLNKFYAAAALFHNCTFGRIFGARRTWSERPIASSVYDFIYNSVSIKLCCSGTSIT